MEEAIREYQAALRYKPGLIQAYNNLGIVYKNQGRYDKAIQQYKTGLKYHPTAELYYNLGIAYQKVGELDQAREAFQRVLEIKPNSAEARRALELLPGD